MPGRAGSHLRRHGVAYAALFIILGGSALALPGTRSVKSDDIAKKAVETRSIAKAAVKGKKIAPGAVKAPKIKDGAVQTLKIADGAVEREKIADNAVNGAKADEATFEGLVFGDGRLFSNAFTVDATTGLFLTPFPVIAEIPGFGVVDMLSCQGDAQDGHMRIRFLSSTESTEFLAIGEAFGQKQGDPPIAALVDSSAGFLGGGGGSFVSTDVTAPSIGVIGHFEWQVSRGSGADATGATIEIEVYNDSGDGDPLGQCHVMAQVVIQD